MHGGVNATYVSIRLLHFGTATGTIFFGCVDLFTACAAREPRLSTDKCTKILEHLDFPFGIV